MTMQTGTDRSITQQRWRRALGALTGVAVFAMLLALSVLVMITGPSAEPAPQMEREWPASYQVVEPGALSPSLKVYGRLESEQQAALRSAVTATVAEVRVQEGDWVNRGDTLVVLDVAELELARRSAEASVKRAAAALLSVVSEYQLARQLAVHHEAQSGLAESKLARFESLHLQGMIADADLDAMRHEANERAMVQARHEASLANHPNDLAQAEGALQEAEARLAQAEMDLQHAHIKAPFNGRVLRIQAATGDRISAGTWVIDIADYDRLRIRAPLPSTTVQQLRQALQQDEPVIARSTIGGQIVELGLQGVAGATREGQSGIDAFFRVPAEALLTLGSVVDLNVVLPVQPNVVALPVHAVYDNNRIYRIRDSRLEALPVERVGDQLHSGEFKVLVRSDSLNGGDHILVSQLPAAMTGLRVTPVQADHGPAATSSAEVAVEHPQAIQVSVR